MSSCTGFRVTDAVTARSVTEICSVFNQRITATNFTNCTTSVGRIVEVSVRPTSRFSDIFLTLRFSHQLPANRHKHSMWSTGSNCRCIGQRPNELVFGREDAARQHQKDFDKILLTRADGVQRRELFNQFGATSSCRMELTVTATARSRTGRHVESAVDRPRNVSPV